MGVNDADHLQAQCVEPREDQFVITARIDHDGLFGDRVADDRAVALQRADGEGFADKQGLCGFHGCSCKVDGTILAQCEKRWRRLGRKAPTNGTPKSDAKGGPNRHVHSIPSSKQKPGRP